MNHSAFEQPIEDDYTPGLYSEKHALSELKEKLGDQKWRLNNLYKIKDKKGQVVTFKMNEAQEKLYDSMHFRNVILKARQLGFTTFIDIYILDVCLFNGNIRAGIIAHHVDDAKAIFEEKIKFPYDNLDPQLKKALEAKTDRSNEMKFANNSTIRVSTSFRSGTLQYLHVSEFGKIAAKYPDKADEIITGAMEAVPLEGMVFVESTAEGREGAFYDMCMEAKKLKDMHRKITNLDFRFHFYPWHENPEYHMSTEGVVVTEEDANYFRDLEGQGINLTDEQKAWWVKKYATLGDKMFREHPSYPEEAFKASLMGAYYGKVITELRRKGRIGDVPQEPGFPVHTFWDLGMRDHTSIWFMQIIGSQKRIIDYYANSGEGLHHYANVLADRGYTYGVHYLPHDVGVRELGTGTTRLETLQNLGVSPINKVDRPKNSSQMLDQIEQTRNFLSTCWIDEAKCDSGEHAGLKCLENYCKEWDDKLGTFKDKPLHNWASHGADSFRTGAVGFQDEQIWEEEGVEDIYDEEY
jgi:hypothetical protein